MPAPDLTLDLSGVALVRSDIQWNRPRTGGRTAYGHNAGVLTQGVGYWTGMVVFERLARRDEHIESRAGGIRGIAALEGFIAEIQESGRTFTVPMPPQGPPLVRYENAADASEAFSADQIGAITVATGDSGVITVPDIGAKKVKIVLLPGTRITVGEKLHVIAYADGTPKTVAGDTPQVVPTTVPEWPIVTTGTDHAYAGMDVEIDAPFAVGRVPVDQSVTLQRAGTWGGPWQIPWEEA